MSKQFFEIDESRDEPRFDRSAGSQVKDVDDGLDEKNMAEFEGKHKLAAQVTVLPA